MSKFRLFLIALFLLPLAALAQAPASSGVEGTITISPVMGGPTRAGDAGQARPLAGTEFVVKQGERVVTSFQTDAQGHFRIPLPPGHYSVVRTEGGSALGSFGPFTVDVGVGKMATVRWKCDSGLR